MTVTVGKADIQGSQAGQYGLAAPQGRIHNPPQRSQYFNSICTISISSISIVPPKGKGPAPIARSAGPVYGTECLTVYSVRSGRWLSANDG
jgi:hypothetical protein